MNIIKIIKFQVLILFPFLLFGQNSNIIQLKSGNFIPEENFSQLLNDHSVLQPALFSGKYYVVIQFNKIPSQQERNTLNLNDIQLIDYLPKNAYTAVIPVNIFFKCIKSLPIRSIFYLNPEQKMSKELKENKIPVWAIKEKGMVDVNVITYEKFSRETIEPDLEKLNIKIIETQPIYRSFRLRLPKEKLFKLAGFSFIQWMEPIPPPEKIETSNF